MNHTVKLDLTDKPNLKNPKRKNNMALANLSICYT